MGTSDNAYKMLIDSNFLRQNGEFFDAYKILNVSPDAPAEEIEEVFKALKSIYESKEKTNLSAPEQLVKDIYLAHTILVKHRQTYDIEYNRRNKQTDYLKAFYKDGKFVDFYEMMGVTKSATDGELRAAYKRILEDNRPTYSDTNEDTLNKNQRIQNAQKVLVILLDNPNLRKLYDEEYLKHQTESFDENTTSTSKTEEEMSFEEIMGIDVSSDTEHARKQENAEKNDMDVNFYNEKGEFIDFYAILSLEPSASTEKIKETFKTLVKDLAVKESDLEKEKKAKQNALVSAALAYEVLTKKRDEYDAKREENFKKQTKTSRTNKDIIYTEIILNSIKNVSESSLYTLDGDLIDFYSILGVSKDATKEEIKMAFDAKVKENTIYYNDTQEITQQKQSALYEIKTAYLVLTKLKDKYDQLFNPIKKYPRYLHKDDGVHRILSQSEIDDLIADMKDEANMQAAQTSPEPNSITETDFYTENGELINFYALVGVSPYSTDQEVNNAITDLKKQYQILESDSEEEKAIKAEMQKYLRLATSILLGPLVEEYDNRLIEKMNKNVAEIEVTESDFYYNKLGELNDFYKLLGIDKDSDEETIVEAFTNKYTEFSINPTDDVDIRVLKALNLNLIIKGYKILTGNLRDVYDSKCEEATKKDETEQVNMERERIEKELESLIVTESDIWTNGVFNDFYHTLSIARVATLDDIKDAFECKINKIEITQSDTPEQQAEKRESQRQLMIAYKVLTGNLKGEYDAIYDTFKEIYEDFEDFDISLEDLYDGVYLRELYNELKISEDSSTEEITHAFEREIYNQVVKVDDEVVKASNRIRLMQAYEVLINEELKNSYLGLIEAEKDMIKHINDNINTLRQAVTENDFYDNGKYGDGSLKNLYVLLDAFKDVSPTELEDALVKKFKEVLVYSEDDEMTRNKKHTEQTELLKAYVILSGSLKTAYDEEFDRVFNRGGANMGTGTDEEKKYEEAEARAREAFNAAQKARLAALKAKLEDEAEKLKAASEEASKAAEAAKEAQDVAKDSLKDAKETANELKKKAKEASKEAKKKKREEKKALKKVKKAERDAEKKLKKSEKKRIVLIRERIGGRLMNPIHFVGKHWKKVVAGITAATVVTGSTFGIYNFAKNRQNNKENDEPSKIQTTETGRHQNPNEIDSEELNSHYMDDEEISDAARIVHENWTDLGLGYTEEEINELVNCVQSRESQIDVDTANEMMTEAINSSYTAASNNITLGEHVFDVKEVDLSTLLSESDAAIDAVCNMEDYLNAMLTDTDSIEDVAKDALEDEVRVIVLGETVDGFNANTSSPVAKLIWARLVSGINSLTGFLGEDFTIEVDGTTYIQSEISNSMSVQSIINAAKSEMGLEVKTMRMNNN